MQDKALTLPNYLWRTITGKLEHYQDQNSSFDELLLFYQNQMNNRFEHELVEPQKYLDSFFFELKKTTRFPTAVMLAKRKIIFNWKERMVFLYYNRKDILITLLKREDYNSTKSKNEATISVYKWLQGMDENNYSIVNSWKKDIEIQNSEILATISQEDIIDLGDNPSPNETEALFKQIKGESYPKDESEPVSITSSLPNSQITELLHNVEDRVLSIEKKIKLTSVKKILNPILLIEEVTQVKGQRGRVSRQITDLLELFSGENILSKQRNILNTLKILLKNSYIKRNNGGEARYLWLDNRNEKALFFAGLIFHLNQYGYFTDKNHMFSDYTEIIFEFIKFPSEIKKGTIKKYLTQSHQELLAGSTKRKLYVDQHKDFFPKYTSK